MLLPLFIDILYCLSFRLGLLIAILESSNFSCFEMSLAVYVYLFYTVYEAIQDVIVGLHHNGIIHSPYSTNYIELHHNMQKFPEYNIDFV